MAPDHCIIVSVVTMGAHLSRARDTGETVGAPRRHTVPPASGRGARREPSHGGPLRLIRRLWHRWLWLTSTRGRPGWDRRGHA